MHPRRSIEERTKPYTRMQTKKKNGEDDDFEADIDEDQGAPDGHLIDEQNDTNKEEQGAPDGDQHDDNNGDVNEDVFDDDEGPNDDNLDQDEESDGGASRARSTQR